MQKNNFDASQTCFHCEWHPMSKHFPVFAITGNYQWIFTEIIFYFKLDLIVFRLQQFINAEITYVTEIFKMKTDFFQYLAHPPLWKKHPSRKT